METNARSSRLRRILRALALPAVALAGALGLRRKVRAGRGRRRGDGGGTAGDREPRRPVPTPLVDAGAAVPD